MTGQLADHLLSFTETRAIKISGVNRDTLRRWRDSGLVRPNTEDDSFGKRPTRLYNLQNVVELSMVRMLRDEGVSMQQIRRVFERLRDRGFMSFEQIQFGHDDTADELFWRQPEADAWEGGRRPGQVAIISTIDIRAIKTRIRESMRRDQSDVGEVTRARGVLGNKLIFAGTRISVEAVQEWIRFGADDARILDAYPGLSAGDIEAARQRMAGAA